LLGAHPRLTERRKRHIFNKAETMIEFVLIAHIWTGMLSKYESQSTVVVYGFKSAAECNAAGTKVQGMGNNGVRSAAFVCVQQTK
jgi:hypothetical protein